MGGNWLKVAIPLALCAALPGFAEAAGRSTVTFRDADSRDRIYYFATGNNDHLVVNYWDGYGWYWADQGLPPGATAISYPSAITYKDTAAKQRIYVFAYAKIGTATNLVVNYWDGSQWHWANHGGDLQALVEPTAVTYVDGPIRRTSVFVQRSDGHLGVNYWNGLSWVWADRGLPAGGFAVSPLDAVTYADGDQRIYVFCRVAGPLSPSLRSSSTVGTATTGSGSFWAEPVAATSGRRRRSPTLMRAWGINVSMSFRQARFLHIRCG